LHLLVFKWAHFFFELSFLYLSWCNL
jgi:hypothetical protein